MGSLFINERGLSVSPFDILVRNFFQETGNFQPVNDTKLPHPVDIYELDSGLGIDVACTGISKEEIDIQIQDNIIRINYEKPKSDEKNYIHKGIARRAFNLGWKIDSKYDLTEANAEFKDGLLHIHIPYAKGSELRQLKIK